MKIATFDSGLRFDDPNLRWGDPSYILEPGDPGYVPPADVFTATQKPKRHKMPKSDYVPNPDQAFSALLQKFKTNIGGYATTLGVAAAQVTAQAADADYYAYTLACQSLMQQYAQQWTAWKDLIREGGTPPAAGAPAAPVFPTAVAAVAPGVEVRFRALAAHLKTHPNYNEGIGEALGIEGDVQAPPPDAAFKPVLKLTLSGGAVQIGWGWQGHRAFLDMIELQVDRGDGHGYMLLAYDTTPNYTDTTPLPATPAKWTYKAIYRKSDERVGQWSDEVNITVGA